MRSVMVALLTYSGEPEPETRESLARSEKLMRARGWDVVGKERRGDSILPRARNAMLAEFLASDCTDLVCIDDDVSWDGDELVRLVEHPADMVGGAYPAKLDKPQYFVLWDTTKPDIRSVDAPRNWLIEVYGVPTGFLKLSRACVERMRIAYANLQYGDDTAPGQRAWCLFNFELWNNRFWGEDFVFCKRWRDIGGKIYLDPMLTLHHHGRTKTGERKTYSGNVGEWMRQSFNQQKDAA